MFIKASVFDKQCTCLVDSGSAVTIISEELYNSMSFENKPELECVSMTLVSATGENICVKGRAIFEFKIGEVIYKQMTLVAVVD